MVPTVRMLLIWRGAAALGIRFAGLGLILAGLLWGAQVAALVFLVRPMWTHHMHGWSVRWAASANDTVYEADIVQYRRVTGRALGSIVVGAGVFFASGALARVLVPIRRRPPRCPVCGYDTSALEAPRCTECGVDLPPEMVARRNTVPGAA